MNKPVSSKLLKYGITAVIGAVIAGLALHLRGFSWSLEPVERYRILCDGFTFPGLLLILTAALIALSNEGAFLGLGFLGSFVLRAFIPGVGVKQEKYSEYLERKSEKGRVKGYGFIFVVGLAYFGLALICLVLFYHYLPG